MAEKHILVVDCGSTGIRALLFNKKGNIIHRVYQRIEVEHPAPGATENSPEAIWEALKNVIHKSMYKPFLKIEALGLTNQRSSFCLWDKTTGEPLTNFINWQDVRAAETARKMNRHPVWRLFKFAATLIGRLTGSPLLTVTSMLTFNTDHSICKLKWLLDNNPEILSKCKNGEVHFGTIDTWCLYKLTGDTHHLTDYTNAAATAMLNPFLMRWNTIFCRIFGIPMNIFPEVKDSNDHFGKTKKEIIGREIPITCMVGDQHASLFGHRCFDPGEVKISMGSGSFVCMNVGKKPRFSKRGLFPLIAWTMKGKPCYMLEGQLATTGTFIDWIIEKLGLFSSVEELNEQAELTESSEGIVCIPTPTGIRFPYFRPDMKCYFSQIPLNAQKKHLARAVFEGLAHRITDIIEGMEKDTKIKISSIKVDGGVSNSGVLLQIIADISGKHLSRSLESDLTSVGAAYLAGLAAGVWKSTHDIKEIKIPTREFSPQIDEESRLNKRKQWKRELKGVMNNLSS